MPTPTPSAENAAESSVYRAALRQKCLAAREAMGAATHDALSLRLQARLASVLRTWALSLTAPPLLAFYFPIQNEFDARPLVSNLIDLGWRLALPVVLNRQEPMIYRAWTPSAAMTTDAYGIPVPVVDERVTPGAVLVPLVAFDSTGYRLGYGGGCFDRTLAVQVPRPFTLGIGFELSRVGTVMPQPHDVRLAAIVTEASVVYYDDCFAGPVSAAKSV